MSEVRLNCWTKLLHFLNQRPEMITAAQVVAVYTEEV